MESQHVIVGLVEEINVLCEDVLGRRDPALVGALQRIQRHAIVVAVVGGYRGGKTALVNALAGSPVCPMDPLDSTEVVTIVHYQDDPKAVARTAAGEATVVSSSEVPAMVVGRGAEPLLQLELGVAAPALVDGLIYVDTPWIGSGGSPAREHAVLGVLDHADGAIIVRDGRRELDRHEVDLIESVRGRCGVAALAVTKSDMAPNWNRIVDADHATLERRGLDVPVVAVAALLEARGVNPLPDGHGLGELRRVVQDRIADPAEAGAARLALEQSERVLAELDRTLHPQISSPVDRVETGPERRDELEANLAILRSEAGRWRQRLADAFSMLTGDLQGRLQRELRSHVKWLDEQLALDGEIDERTLRSALEQRAAQSVASVGADLVAGVYRVETEISRVVRDDLPSLELTVETPAFVPQWRDVAVDDNGSPLDAVRGAQGGIVMLGITSSLLPAAAAATLLAPPVLLGAGLVFGTSAVRGRRRRRRQTSRSRMRAAGRQLIDDANFHAGGSLTNELRQAQIALRVHFDERLRVLEARWKTEHAELDGGGDEHDRFLDARRTQLADLTERLDSITRSRS